MAKQQVTSYQRKAPAYWQGWMAGVGITTAAQNAGSIAIPALGQQMLLDITAAFEINYAGTAFEAWVGIWQGATEMCRIYHNSVNTDYFQTVTLPVIIQTAGGETIYFKTGRTTGSGGSVGARSRYVIKVLGVA